MATMPLLVQQNPSLQRRLQLAQAMMGRQQPVRDWSSGLANAANSIAGAMMARRTEADIEADRRTQYATLARAISASAPWQNPDSDPEVSAQAALTANDSSRRYLAPGEIAQGTGGLAALAAALAGDERLAPLALRIHLNRMLEREKAAVAAAARRADTDYEHGLRKDLEQYKARLKRDEDSGMTEATAREIRRIESAFAEKDLLTGTAKVPPERWGQFVEALRASPYRQVQEYGARIGRTAAPPAEEKAEEGPGIIDTALSWLKRTATGTSKLPPKDKLVRGQTYTLPDGRSAVWDGDGFMVQ